MKKRENKKRVSRLHRLIRANDAGDKVLEESGSGYGSDRDAEAQRKAWAEEQKAKEAARFDEVMADEKKKGGRSRLNRFVHRRLSNYLLVVFILAAIIVFITESCAHLNPFGGFVFLFSHPLKYLVNTLIVYSVLSLSLLFHRRVFSLTVFSCIWLVLAAVNGVILSQRMTPLTTSDIAELRDGLSIATNYFDVKQLIIFGGVAALVVFFIVLMFVRMPKIREKINYKKSFAAVAVIWVVMLVSVFGGQKIGVMDTFFPNLAYGFRDNGFDYCFLATWLDQGVDKPKDYSAEQVTGLFTEEELNTTVPGRLTTTETVASEATESYPNIIIVQLESFMDPTCIDGITYSTDPIPNFRRLQSTCSSGLVQVPSMGAGTANTEFEVLTGMSEKFFGPGETPYKTTLVDQTVEALPYDLDAYGYSSHAIHNHRGAFYGRNKVYPNEGFDTFTSLEYMNGITTTPKNWAKDDVLPSQVFDALNSTSGKDFVFTVSVQGHGRYPEDVLLTDPNVEVTGMPEGSSEGLKNQWEYYVNQVYDMDAFVGELVDEVSNYDEPTIVVFYGDHMPALDNISDETLEGRNMFQTDYLIYANFDFEEEDKDLYAYQLAAYVLGRLDIHNGTMITYHQNHSDDENYYVNMQILQYDMLYGNQYIYDGQTPYTATNMQMGVKEIKVTGISKVGDKYYIQGQNFTPYSKVNLDGEILKTTYLSPTLLEVKEEVDESDVPRMKVSQVEKDNEILSTTE